MGRIMQVREMQTAYLACTSALQRRNRDYQQGDGKVFTDLMQWELDEWRNLLTWGIVMDDATQDRIKAAVHERFLADKMHVADWFHNKEEPGRWLTADETEFRKMAKQSFLGKGGA